MTRTYRVVRRAGAVVPARRASTLALALGLIATACGGVGGETGTTAGTATTSSAASAATTADRPSQSPADASRDGVVAALAALPLDVRVGIVREAPAAEGVWVLSRPTAAAAPASGCRIGPDAGNYPTDWICTTEYGELLLLDAGRTTILRAYPLPAVAPDLLQLTDGAVYCGRGPDAASLTPDAMVCRVDRASLAATVRIFPAAVDSVVVQPCFTLPAGWTVGTKGLDLAELRTTATGVAAVDPSGAVTELDPLTLAERAPAVRTVAGRARPTTGACSAPVRSATVQPAGS